MHGTDVQGQGGGKMLDVDGQGDGVLDFRQLSWTPYVYRPLPPLNPGGVSLLVGTNFPHLILHRGFRSEESHQPFAVKIL